MLCNKCKRTIPDDALICPYCGEQVRGSVKEDVPYKENATTVKEDVPYTENAATPAGGPTGKKRGSLSRTVLIVACIVVSLAIVAAAVLAVLLIVKPGSSNEPSRGSDSLLPAEEAVGGSSEESAAEPSEGTVSVNSKEESSGQSGAQAESSKETSSPVSSGSEPVDEASKEESIVAVSEDEPVSTVSEKEPVSEQEPVDATVYVKQVRLNETSMTLTVGSSFTLTPVLDPSNATNQAVSWKSDDTSVATVDANGRVLAKGKGTATITVQTKDGNKTATCSVTVKEASVSVTGVQLNQGSMTLEIGETAKLTATVSPSNATNKAVNWFSSNPTVASVQSGTVTAKNAGTAIITVATSDGGYSTTCLVTVIGKYALTFDANGGSVSEKQRVLTAGSSYGTLPVPTREYYSFSGWYTSPSGGSKVSSGTTMGNGSVTVYAQWTLNAFSGVWSGWSDNYVQADEYTHVETRTVYVYSVYRILVYNHSDSYITARVYKRAKEGGAAESVYKKIQSIIMGTDPFNTGLTFEDDPIPFTVQNANALHALDSNITLKTAKYDSLFKYSTIKEGESIKYDTDTIIDGEEWMIDILNYSVKTQYRYEKRVR